MTIPTPAELTLLRTRPHSTTLWLSVYKPEIVLQCQVNGSLGPGGRVIAYNNVTIGSYLAVEAGMTLYLHSAQTSTPLSTPSVGKIRVRSITSTEITVAENDDINWIDGQYITIVRFVEINAVFPRIIQDPGDPTNTIWYKDYDIAYTNQNDFLGAFVCMGSHYAGFLEGGQHQIYYSASGTTHVLGSAMTYDWFFQGATVTGSSAHTPGYITYDTPGHYQTRLTVTGASGTSDVSYRYISIYDRPGEGSNVPVLQWALKTIHGNREGGGYTADIAVYEPNTDIVDGALVVIFADDWYGSTQQSIGGALNRQKIVFVGYVLDGSVSVNYETSTLEFKVGSPTEVMKQVTSFSVGVNSSSSPVNEPSVNPNIPSSWAVVINMNVQRAIYHYLRWHSTVLMTNDFQFTATDQNIQFFDADRASLYDSIKTLMDGTLAGELVCDRNGKIWAEPSVASVNLPETVYPTNMIMSNHDWMGKLDIDEVFSKQVSYLEMGGIVYPGPGFDSTPLMACAPGATPAYRGEVIALQGMALASQAQLNTLVGNMFAWKNARYPKVKAKLAGNYRNLDIAPIELVMLNLSADDNIRNISWANKHFAIQEMDWSYNSEKEAFIPTLGLHERTRGIDGETIVIPVVPPTTAPGGGGFSIPTIQIPPIPMFPIQIITSGGGGMPDFIPAAYSQISGGTDEFPDNNGLVWLYDSVTREACSLKLYIPTSTTFTQVVVTPIFAGQGGDAGDVYIATQYDIEGIDGASNDTGTTGFIATTVQEPDNEMFSYAGNTITIPLIPNSVMNVSLTRQGGAGGDTYTSAILVAGFGMSWS